MKICFTASSGGHLDELSRLKNIVGKNDFILTEKSSWSIPDWCKHVYYVQQVNRKELLFIIKVVMIFFKSLMIIIKEKPAVIISTGALATIPICVIGKVLGLKIIYIESFARVDQPSLTGKLMYHFADLFIVQWKDLLTYFPNALYGGPIF